MKAIRKNKLLIFCVMLFLGQLSAQVSRPEKDIEEFERIGKVKEPYELGQDSKAKKDVPKGTLETYVWESEKIYPGTTRDYWVYVPQQYDSSKPACLAIFQDGDVYLDYSNWSKGIAPTTVFDNLIYQEEIPVTIAVFLKPGDKGPGAPYAGGMGNRSFEYDSVTDLYARFLLEEIIPELKKKYNITDNPKGRILVGFSSGAICAFNAAWHRPDEFGNVISHCGSYTDIRGGHIYPPLVRRTPKKPIRVFLQSGKEDFNSIWGNWPLANQAIASALEYAEYDFRFEFGEGTHSLNHGGQVFPETLRWIWRDNAKQ